jgi:hypothetical protein
VLRRIFEPKGKKWQEAGEDCIMRSFITCTIQSNQGGWLENPKGRDHSEGVCVDGRIMLEWISRKYIGKALTGFIWRRIETSGGLL